MKQAKDKFDGLVQRIQEGDTVNFGQMEEVFAQAFLSRFLKDISSESNQKKTNQFFQEHLAGNPENHYDEYGKLPELSSDQQMHYELELTRSVISTLGVRPTTDDLSNYIERAVQMNDWKLLDNVLSLTQEGTLREGTLEEIAIQKLERGNIDSYRNLKENFPDIRIDSPLVNPIYEKMIFEGNLRGVKETKNETKIPIPAKTCQAGYEQYLDRIDSFSIKEMLELRDISSIAPLISRKVKSDLRNLYSNLEVQQRTLQTEDLDNLDELFGIYSDSKLAVAVQRSAIEADQIKVFGHVYRNSTEKIPQKDVRKSYARWDKADKSEIVAQVMEITKAAPTREIFSRTASVLLYRGDLPRLRSLASIDGNNPGWEQDAVDDYSTSLAAEGKISHLEKLSKLGMKIREEYVHTAAGNFIAKREGFDFEALEERVGDFYQILRMKPSAEVTGAKIGRLTSMLNRSISNAIGKFKHRDYNLDPLTPIQGENIGLHNKFKSKVKMFLKSYISKIKKIKKENPEANLQEKDSVNELYSTCLEIALAQALTSDNKYIGVRELSNTLGVPVSRENVRTAVYNHIRRNSGDRSKDDSIRVLATVNKAGIEIEVDTEIHNQVAQDLVSRAKNIGYTLNNLKKLTGNEEFSQDVYDAARTRAVSDLTEVNLSEYDSLVKLTGEITLSENERKKIGEGIVYKLKKDPSYKYIDTAKKIIEMTEIEPYAKPGDLYTMVKNYFEKTYWNTEPSKIARVVGQKLNQDQVFDRCIELIDDGALGPAKALYKDTGFHPTKQGARDILSEYNSDSQKVMIKRLNEVFGSKSGVR